MVFAAALEDVVLGAVTASNHGCGCRRGVIPDDDGRSCVGYCRSRVIDGRAFVEEPWLDSEREEEAVDEELEHGKGRIESL
jgi:hypothetical protein